MTFPGQGRAGAFCVLLKTKQRQKRGEGPKVKPDQQEREKRKALRTVLEHDALVRRMREEERRRSLSLTY